MLFKPGLVYPSDEVGEHTELNGEVVKIGESLFLSDAVAVSVKTSEGVFIGYTFGGLKHAPKAGYQATIRLYRSGGGWYPDDRIVGWSSRSSK